MNLKKVFKITAGLIVFLTLPSLLFFGFLYLKYHEDIPTGISGEQADAFANKMLEALQYEDFQKTNYLEWTFKKKHHYKWKKNEGSCYVYWKEYKVNLDLNNYSQSKAYVHNFKVTGEQAEVLIDKAIYYFNNDSFWLVAPYKVFDPGTERHLVSLDNGEKALLVTYTAGGTTPGDSYLWKLDQNGRPTSFRMWTSLLPIDGLEASWSDWTTTESGAQLPTFHKILLFGIDMGHVKGSQ